MSSNIDNLDEETKAILQRALSAQAQLHSMGMNDKQAGNRAQEQADFAAEMERKNELARQRRANAMLGISPEEALAKAAAPQVSTQKPPTSKKKRGTGMVKQNAANKIMPSATMPKEGDFEVENIADSSPSAANPAPYQPQVKAVEPSPEQMAALLADVQKARAEQAEERVMQKQAITPQPFDTTKVDHDFEAFTEIVNWPSRGLMYPNPIYGQSFKTIDLLMLGDITEENASRVLTSVLSKRIKGINVDDILTCDETYLLHWLRASSYPTEGLPHPGYICPHCKFNIRKADTFKEFRINFGNLKFVPNHDPVELISKHKELGYVPITLYDGRECDIYLRRRAHDIILENERERWEREHDYESMPDAIYRLAQLAVVVEIEDCATFDDKLNYLAEFPIAKKSELFDAITENALISRINAEIKCAQCGGTVETPYPFLIRSFISSL